MTTERSNNIYKVPKGTSFKEFYYRGLSINTSAELRAYILSNKWYFDKMAFEIQEQFRSYWRYLKNEEERENELFR